MNSVGADSRTLAGLCLIGLGLLVGVLALGLVSEAVVQAVLRALPLVLAVLLIGAGIAVIYLGREERKIEEVER